MLGFDGGAIGADIYCDRSGIHGKTLADCALILDALKDADTGYYDPRDPFTHSASLERAKHTLFQSCMS